MSGLLSGTPAQRLLATVAEKKVPGVVVLGGDAHANYVADLKADYDDPKSPVIASEFCGTSISSLGLPQARVAQAPSINPHLHFARSDQRGYQRFVLKAGELQADLRALDNALDVDSGIGSAGRFIVTAGKPGPRSV